MEENKITQKPPGLSEKIPPVTKTSKKETDGGKGTLKAGLEALQTEFEHTEEHAAPREQHKTGDL